MFRRAVLAALALFFSTAPFAFAQTHTVQGVKPAKAAAPVAAATPAAIGTHYLGWIDERARITITFSADFDPVASATIMRFGQRAADGLVDGYDMADDDSGGGFNPRIDVDAPHGGYLVLFVSPYANAGPGGCYFYKVEIRTP